MFWKKNSNDSKIANSKTPDNTRIYAIGDIHGQLDLLLKMHDLILEDAKDFESGNIILIYLGDYIDRGIETKSTIDLLVENNLNKFKNIYIKGNHEDAMQTFLKKPDFGNTWFLWGGEATLRSYGVSLHDKNNKRLQMSKLSDDLKDSIPVEHKVFFDNLKKSHIEGDYIFVHAGLKPGISIDKQQENDMLTIRDEFVYSKKRFDKTVVFGHTIFKEPFNENGRIGVDTGAYIYGKLSCVVLEGESVRFLTADRHA